MSRVASTHRLVLVSITAALVASSSACGPKESTLLSDLDGDGIKDAFDQCLADPEDLDGAEDDDGCPEAAGPDDVAEAGPVAEVEDVKVAHKELAKPEETQLRDKDLRAKVTPFQKSAASVFFAGDESTAVIEGFNKSWLVSGGKKRKLDDQVADVDFSRDGSRVALTTPAGIVIRDTASGKTLRTLPYDKDNDETAGKSVRFDGESASYFDGCQLQSARVTGGELSAKSARLCGRAMRPEGDGPFVVWQRELDSTTVLVYKLDGEKKPELVLGGTGDGPGLSDLVFSPDGRFLCYSRHRDGSELSCRDLEKQRDLVVWKDATDRRASFDSEGHLLFAAGPRGKKRTLYRADLASDKLVELGPLSASVVQVDELAPGRYVASGGPKLVVFDLDKGERLHVSLGEGEWEGLSVLPGSLDTFIVGKERRGSRDLMRVELP